MTDVPGGGAAQAPRGGGEKKREWGKTAALSPRAPIVLGIDPGGRWTGLAGRQGNVPLWASLVTREDRRPLPSPDYLAEVIDDIEAALKALGAQTDGDVILAVETMVQPRGYRITSSAGLIGPAMVLGAVLGYFDAPLLVPPAKHGQGPQQGYPKALWGRKEKAGTGRYRHIRSAWDIAGAGLVMARGT